MSKKKRNANTVLKNVLSVANTMNGMVLATGEKDKAGFGRRESVALTYAFARGMATGAHIMAHGGRTKEIDMESHELDATESLSAAAKLFNHLIDGYPERRDHMLALESSERPSNDVFIVKNKHYSSQKS